MQVKRYKLDKILLKGTVEHIIPVIGDTKGMGEEQETQRESEQVKVHPRKKVEHFCVELQDGSILRAQQVVLATGPTRVQMSNIPEWVKSIEESYPEGRLQHTVHLMHKPPNSKQRLQEMDCPGQEETSSGQGKIDFSFQ